MVKLWFALFVVSCSCPLLIAEHKPPKPSLALSEKPAEAQAQLLREIPVGTDLAQATQWLESHQFKVSRLAPDKYFARLNRAKGFLVEVSWLVDIRTEDGKLQELTLKVGYTGP